jgi:hypothetical protein
MNPKLAQRHLQPLLQLWCKNVVNFESRHQLAAKLTVATKTLKPEGEGRESERDSEMFGGWSTMYGDVDYVLHLQCHSIHPI